MAAPSNAVDRLIEMVTINLGRYNARSQTIGTGTLSDYVLVWINDTQTEICNKANFWFMRATTTLSLSASDTTTSLPSDFKDDDSAWIVETDGWTELDMIDYHIYRRKFDDSTTGEPTHYVLGGSGNILFRPVPDDSYTIRLDYWKYLTDLAASGSSNTLLNQYPDVLETGATYRGYRYLGELEDAATWKALYEQKLKDLVIANAERELPDEMVLNFRPDVYGSPTKTPKNRGNT